MSNRARMNRLFGQDGKCLNVALDHGIFNEPSLLKGIEDLRRVVGLVLNANPDAVQLSSGQAGLLQDLPYRHKPALVLRTDISNVYDYRPGYRPFCHLAPASVEEAVRLDAACVVASLLSLPGQTDLYLQCIANITSLKTRCERFGIPLMVESVAFRPDPGDDVLLVDSRLEVIASLVRQAVEMGADIIKADPTENLECYHQIVELASGVPVLVRGGGRRSEEDLLNRTYVLVKQGISGITYGRNIIQHPIPDKMTLALKEILHDGKRPDVAIGQIRL